MGVKKAKRPYLRVEIVTHGKKVLEAVVPDDTTAMDLMAWWAQRHHALGLPIGGGSVQLDSMPRAWDVPVGTWVSTKEDPE